MAKLTFGYWFVRALAQPIRHLLAYCELDFDEVVYSGREQWFEGDKHKLGLDFPNLPYLIDGDLKLTESEAILKYIPERAGKPELLGRTPEDVAHVDNILALTRDLLKLRVLAFNKEWKTAKHEHL